MDDYSRYAEMPSEFIISYEVENNEIVVNTKKTKKGEPKKFKATKTKIKYYEGRLEKQYKTIIKKQDEILQSKIDTKDAIYLTIAMTFCILSALSSSFSDILGMFLCGTGILTLIITAIDNAIYIMKFQSKMKLYSTYLSERKQLEQCSEQNQTVTENLNRKSLSILSKNRELKERDLIDCIFNINFMDKVSLCELRKLLYSYSIHEESAKGIIDENPELKIISYKDRIKKRVRSKEKKGFKHRGCRYE